MLYSSILLEFNFKKSLELCMKKFARNNPILRKTGVQKRTSFITFFAHTIQMDLFYLNMNYAVKCLRDLIHNNVTNKRAI